MVNLSVHTSVIFNCFLGGCAQSLPSTRYCTLDPAQLQPSTNHNRPQARENRDKCDVYKSSAVSGAGDLNLGRQRRKVPSAPDSFLLKYWSLWDVSETQQDSAARQTSKRAAEPFFPLISSLHERHQVLLSPGVSRSVNPSASEACPLHAHESTEQPHQQQPPDLSQLSSARSLPTLQLFF